MESLLKLDCDGLEVEFESIPVNVFDDSETSLQREINQQIEAIDNSLDSIQNRIDVLNAEIDKLTSHADCIDYMVAVASGVLSGFVDSVFVGEWNFKKTKASSNRFINERVMDFAKTKGFAGNRLDDAISYLERSYKLPGDGSFIGRNMSISADSHHLDDICHHPSIVGLICCVVVQLSESSVYVNKDGKTFSVPVHINDYGRLSGEGFAAQVFCGVVNWFINVAGAMSNAYGHWMSDLAGSSTAVKGGAGLPGPIMSLLKEFSAIPGIGSPEFGDALRKAFQGGFGNRKSQIDIGAFNALFKGADSKLDYRTEMAVVSELKRQAIPVVLNEVLVRSFYFVKHLAQEMRAHHGVGDVDWEKVMPVGNRTITRMLTIAHGTLTAIDLADAAIRSGVKSKGNGVAFFENMILRVNFVGLGRFAIGIVTDVSMCVQRELKRRERSALVFREIDYLNAKILYQQANMWILARETALALQNLERKVNSSDYDKIASSIEDMLNNLKRM